MILGQALAHGILVEMIAPYFSGRIIDEERIECTVN